MVPRLVVRPSGKNKDCIRHLLATEMTRLKIQRIFSEICNSVGAYDEVFYKVQFCMERKDHSRTSLFTLVECDQIWQNFKRLWQCLRLYLVFGRFFNFIFLQLGTFSLFKMAKFEQII